MVEQLGEWATIEEAAKYFKRHKILFMTKWKEEKFSIEELEIKF